MKKKDIALLVVVGIVSGVIALLITSTVVVGKDTKELKAETASKISSEFKKPDNRVFNEQSINPTQLIQIGDSTNPNPLR